MTADDFYRIDASWKLSYYEEELQNPDSCTCLLIDKGILVGFVFYRLSSVMEAWIVHLAVKKQGVGAGSKLMQLFLDEIKVKGVISAGLEARHHNMAALALYKKFGFKIISTRAKYYSNGDDAIVMLKVFE
jgi:ribosomal-protein-alanine N-acetyltransferase